MTPPAPSPGRPAPRPTADLVLDAAERLAQTRGFNGFSYADVSAAVGITTASLHYHFPGKAELGRALVERYTAAFAAALAGIAAREDRAAARLDGYARLYGDVLAAGRMCLCGMLAAEYETLPQPVQRAIRAFFDANEAWLSGVLERGRSAGDISFAGSARDAARQWTSTLEGSMLLARPFADPTRLTSVARRMIDEFTRGAAGASSPTSTSTPRRKRATARSRRG
jgi:TetR/AcrR family transcriptional regulator, transcriptional repressor for nem operon